MKEKGRGKRAGGRLFTEGSVQGRERERERERKKKISDNERKRERDTHADRERLRLRGCVCARVSGKGETTCVSCNTWMSRSTGVNESCRTCE